MNSINVMAFKLKGQGPSSTLSDFRSPFLLDNDGSGVFSKALKCFGT